MADNLKWLGGLVAFGCVLGCEQPEPGSPDVDNAKPRIDLSIGTVDPKLVGTWINAEETYRLKADGTFQLHFDRMEQTGPSKSNLQRKVGNYSGKWVASKGDLLLSVEKGESGAKHRMNIVMHEQDKIMELRPTFLKKGQGTIYKRGK